MKKLPILTLGLVSSVATAATVDFTGYNGFTGLTELVSSNGEVKLNTLDDQIYIFADNTRFCSVIDASCASDILISFIEVTAKDVSIAVDSYNPGDKVQFRLYDIEDNLIFKSAEIVSDQIVDFTGYSGIATIFVDDLGSTKAGFNYELSYTSDETSEVPVPAAAWLFGSALAGLAGLRRKVVALLQII